MKYDDDPDLPYQMTIHGEFFLNDEVVPCPECGGTEELVMTAFAQDSATSFQCLNRHTWFREDMPGRVVQELYRASVVNPDAQGMRIWLGDYS